MQTLIMFDDVTKKNIKEHDQYDRKILINQTE